jgi:hypothetical protein
MRTLIVFLVLACSTALAADISGTWVFDVVLDAGGGTPTFTFKQTGEKLTGKYAGQLGESDVVGTVKGNAIEFSFEISGGGEKLKVTYKGTIETALSMKGTADYGGVGKGTWTAAKK